MGGTFDADGLNLEDCKRYAVAIYPDCSFTTPSLTVPIVESAFAKYQRDFGVYSDGGLGFWHNPKDALWYIEAVRLFNHRIWAEVYAEEFKQEAYYHLDCNVPVEERRIYVKEAS